MVPEYNCVPGMYAENGLGARVDGAEKLNFAMVKFAREYYTMIRELPTEKDLRMYV